MRTDLTSVAVNTCVQWSLVLFTLIIGSIYLLALILWLVVSVLLLTSSSRRLVKIKQDMKKHDDEYLSQRKALYHERTIRYRLCVIFILIEIVGQLYNPIVLSSISLRRDSDNSTVLLNIGTNITVSPNLIQNLSSFENFFFAREFYFRLGVATSATLFLVTYCAHISYFIMYWVMLKYLRMAVKRKIQPLRLLGHLCSVFTIAGAQFILLGILSILDDYSPASYYIQFGVMSVSSLVWLILIFVTFREANLFIRELKWSREDALSYYTPRCPRIQEKNWLISKYKLLIRWQFVCIVFLIGLLIVSGLVPLFIKFGPQVYRAYGLYSHYIISIPFLFVIGFNISSLSLILYVAMIALVKYINDRRKLRFRFHVNPAIYAKLI